MVGIKGKSGNKNFGKIRNTGRTQFKKGIIPWNKGINCWKNKEHPKGMFGKENKWGKHSEESKKKISKVSKEQFKNGRVVWNYIDGRSKNCSPARYGDDWSKIRLLIYKRDNFTCQFCKLSINDCIKQYNIPLHIHHKIPFLLNFDNSLSNLITLCPSCHRKEDARIIKQMKGGKILI